MPTGAIPGELGKCKNTGTIEPSPCPYAVPQGTFDGDTRSFAVRARFKYTDGTYSDYFYANFQPTIHGWQFSSVAMVAKKAYSQITVAAVYHYNVNTIYLDGIQLFKEEYGTSYTYDDDGNVISVVDLQKKNTTYEYNSDNDLTKILENDKAKVTYTYDDYHNVKTAKTEEGLEYSFDYDRFGNNTKVTIGSGNTTISSEAYYNEDEIKDNDDTSDDGNRLVKTVDALGKITKYGYDPNTNVLDWVQYPEDTDGTGNTADTRTKYDYDSMFRTASAACTTSTGKNMSAVYTYTDDLLTSVKTPTTTYKYNYGDFALRSSVVIGDRELASYNYTKDRNHYLESLDYGNGDRVEYEYDKKGRVVKEIRKDVEKDESGNPSITQESVEYLYDNSGNLAKKIDSASGRTTTYFYDLLDRMVKYEEKGADYFHSVSYEYDENNNLSKQVEVTNGVTTTTTYTYDDDNRIESVCTGNTTVTYTYDSYGRVSKKVTKNGDATFKTETYTYTAPKSNATSSQIATHTIVCGEITTIYNYRYDDNGNILTVSEGINTTSYEYDSTNQLLRETYQNSSQQDKNYTHTWEYDNAGNILKRKEFSDATDDTASVTPTHTVTYSYPAVSQGTENTVWGDLLIKYGDPIADGEAPSITYDEIGNPLNGNGRTYTWKNGRQLSSLTDGNTTWEYEYNADGMRTKRTNGTATYEYIYNGSLLTQMKLGNDTYSFTYDANGVPLTVTHNGTTYYYSTSVFGDVIAILDSTKANVVSYAYDAWGNHLSISGTMAATLGQTNPLRYRGYVYDTETQLYYLQSRYYNPEIGRFINADALVATGHNFTGNNMFLYCYNDPVSRVEISGYISEEAAIKLIDENAAAIKEAAEDHGVDPAIIAACIYTEQVLNVNLWDAADVLVYFFDTSIGVGQVKVSTAILLEDLGYVEKTEPVKFWFITITSRRKRVAEKLNDNKTNIEYVAAYLEYWQDQWEDTLDISQMPEILGTLYNIGVNAKAPNTSPKPNNFGTHVKTKYDMLKKRLG